MRAVTIEALPGTTVDPRYPDSDGRPMGDTAFHTIAMRCLADALEDFFASWADVYVAMNMIFYYERGNPRGRRDPDVLVARGVVGKHPRRSYRLWEEGVLPCTFFEIVSEKTWRTDLYTKRELYARLGIREYFLFDPEGKYLAPALRGFRLEDGVSVDMVPDTDGGLTSAELGLRFVQEGGMLRLIDRRTGRKVPTRGEVIEKGKRRAQKLAAEVEQLRAQLRQHNGLTE